MKPIFVVFVALAAVVSVDACAQTVFSNAIATDEEAAGWQTRNLEAAYYRKAIFGSEENMGKTLITVASIDGQFGRTYLINEHGETISSGHSTAVPYTTGQGLVLVGSQDYTRRDSFNPYGATDMGQALFIGAINSFFGRFKRKNRD